MSRYIDADELMEILRANRYYPFGVSIDEVPTVDAVSVIRCKDCKYYTGKWCTKYSAKQFDMNDICKDDDDFCSKAEGKDNG